MKLPERAIPNTKSIDLFMHCAKCIEEQQGQQLEVGWTALGLQVWCKRHDKNVVHIDFGGLQLHANTTALIEGLKKV